MTDREQNVGFRVSAGVAIVLCGLIALTGGPFRAIMFVMGLFLVTTALGIILQKKSLPKQRKALDDPRSKKVARSDAWGKRLD